MKRSVLPLTVLLAAAPLAIALVASPSPGRGGQQPPPPVFNASQAASGTSVYAASCASCHMADLAGRNEAPQLAGNNFMNTWRNAVDARICSSSSSRRCRRPART